MPPNKPPRLENITTLQFYNHWWSADMYIVPLGDSDAVCCLLKWSSWISGREVACQNSCHVTLLTNNMLDKWAKVCVGGRGHHGRWTGLWRHFNEQRRDETKAALRFMWMTDGSVRTFHKTLQTWWNSKKRFLPTEHLKYFFIAEIWVNFHDYISAIFQNTDFTKHKENTGKKIDKTFRA